jgi:hypothetical protein
MWTVPLEEKAMATPDNVLLWESCTVLNVPAAEMEFHFPPESGAAAVPL